MTLTYVAVVFGYIAAVFVAILGAIILWRIWTDKINLDTLLTEANGLASMSRLQLLIFTFVIALSLLILVATKSGGVPDIPGGVLTLLGISASTYAVGKGISYSRDEGVTTDGERNQRRDAITKLDPAAQVAAIKQGDSGF